MLGWTLQRSELTKAARDHFGYVALYGDSKFNAGPLSDRKNNTNTATKWWWVQGDDSGYRLKMINSVPTYVSNNGYYKARVPYATSEFKGRFGSWCDKGDGICTGKFFDGALFGTHGSAYQDDPKNAKAPNWISKSASVITAAALAKVNKLNPKPSPTTSTAPAQSVGAAIWNTEFTDMSTNDLTAYSGGVMVNGCSGSGRSFVGLNNSGVVNNRGFVQSETARYGKCIVGKNGVVYAQLVSHDSNNYNPATYRYDIVAFSGGSVLWKTELTGNTLGTWRSVGQMVIGADGNLYALLTDGGKTRQAGFDYATGKTLFDVAVDGNSYFLLPYKLGIIMWPMYSGQARYFDYRGNQRLAFTPTFSGSAGRRVYSADGDVFVMSYQPRKSDNKCRYATVGWQMTKFTANGTVAWSNPVTACAMVGAIYSTPSGGVVATGTGGSSEWMVAFDAAGKQLWNRDLGALAVNWSDSTIVDTHGNVVFRQIYSIKSGGAAKFDVLSGATGQTIATFNTESAGLGSYRLGSMASASDKLFVEFNKTCSKKCNASKVYAFSLPGIGASYPGILG